MADGNFQNQPNNNQYFYYNQQYPPQFYYQYDPQNYFPQDISQNYYYQGGDNIDYYYSQRGDNPHSPQRGNIQYRGGRGQLHFNSRDNRDIDGHFQSNKQDQVSNFQDNKETNFQKADGKENIQDSTRNRHDRNYSDNYVGNRGRGRGYHNNSRQFYRGYHSGPNRENITFNNSSSNNERDKTPQTNVNIRNDSKRGQGQTTRPDKYSGGRNDRSNEYHTDSNVDISESRQGHRYRGGNYRGQGHQQYERRDNRDISKKDSGRSQQDSSNNTNNTQNTYHSGSDRNSKDRNKQYSAGGRGSPRQIDMDSRASFDKRNNPKQRESNTTDGSNDGEKQDKKYKMPSSDRKYTNKKQMMKLLAGKVDETQRGLLIEQLTLGTYECMVCCETVRCHHAVWNCSGCYHVFHLRCIKKWARSPTALVEGEGSGWRCPACQKVTDLYPNQYKCFCSKLRDPEWDRMETPHSCGQVCGKKRGDNCSHSCNILCHPGPCPPCSAVVNRTCACGKESKAVKCSITEVMKCEKVCGKVLNCGKHFCKATCHSGSCDPCEEIVVKECYGSHEKKEVKCGCAESFSKSYSCEKPCLKTLLCGNHECDLICHAGDCKTCETLPEVVTHCPCGATPLSEQTKTTRLSCLDPVPTCEKICNKPLGCGPTDGMHRCNKNCHEGPCGPCEGVTTLTCRCGAIDKDIPCVDVHQYTEDHPFTCDKRCNKKRTCGRHKCGQLCCVNEVHLCIQLCNQKLSCGLHKCAQFCHRGNCPPCLMSGYDELSCHCGAEVMLPPIPCGTKPPECKNVCLRQHECDHTVYHHCHSDSECPPCTVLTEKWCMGKHELRKNIPCHLNNVSCGLPCNKVLPCQQHKCLKICHAGDCQKENEHCVQLCRIKRKDCNHICRSPCHHGSPCPQTPCKAEVLLMCKCGNKEAKVPCLSGASIAQDTAEYQKLTMQSLAGSLQSGQPVDISQLAKKKFKRQLDCDAECAVLERNRRMALALEIKNPDLGAKLGNPTYTDFLKDYTKQNAHIVSSIEKALSDLVKNAKQSKHPHRSHSFSPGNRDQRRAIHELAEFYGCETQSYDYEPKKNVVATAQRDKCWLPSVTLTSYIQRELHPKAPLPIPHVHSEAALRQTAQAAKQSTVVLGDAKPPSSWQFSKPDSKKKTSKPEIDYFDFSTN